MHFSSFFSLVSSVIFVLYSCRPTAADALAVSPVKPRTLNSIECSGGLPPGGLPQSIQAPFRTLLGMCALRIGRPQNMGCGCRKYTLVCGTTRQPDIQSLIDWCFSHCECGHYTRKLRDEFTKDLDSTRIYDRYGKLITVDASRNQVADNVQLPSGNNPGSTHTCSGTCTSVNHGCKSASSGDCKCFAPPVSLFYWHLGDCGTRLPFKAKRDLAQHRRDYYLNATAQYASSNHATATPPTAPGLHAQQLASGLLPSPCNASYVSFACSDSSDGIVHEPPQNWLGALLPEDHATASLPPVPEGFLRIHGR